MLATSGRVLRGHRRCAPPPTRYQAAAAARKCPSDRASTDVRIHAFRCVVPEVKKCGRCWISSRHRRADVLMARRREIDAPPYDLRAIFRMCRLACRQFLQGCLRCPSAGFISTDPLSSRRHARHPTTECAAREPAEVICLRHRHTAPALISATLRPVAPPFAATARQQRQPRPDVLATGCFVTNGRPGRTFRKKCRQSSRRPPISLIRR